MGSWGEQVGEQRAAAGGSWSEQAWAEGAFLAQRARGQGTWEGAVGPAGSGCVWERPEHSSQTDSAARPPAQTCLSASLRQGGKKEGG